MTLPAGSVAVARSTSVARPASRLGPISARRPARESRSLTTAAPAARREALAVPSRMVFRLSDRRSRHASVQETRTRMTGVRRRAARLRGLRGVWR